jgi:hypothetical protein
MGRPADSVVVDPSPARRRHLRTACSLAALLLAGTMARAAEATLDFDFAQAHDFLGFGTQVWLKGDRGGKGKDRGDPEGGNEDAGWQLLKELNARFVRVSLIPKITFDQLRPGMSVEQYLDVLERNDNPAQRQRLAAFNQRLRELKIQPVLIFWRMPEPWAEKRQQKAGSKQQAHFARPDRIGDYANLVTAQMTWLQRQGVQAAAVELTNEPQGAWDTKYEREDYAALVQKTRAAMDANGLQRWPIAGPGTGIPNFDHYIGGVLNSPAAKSLGYVSAHVYLTPEVLADRNTAGMASFLGRGKFGPILITEFGVKKHNEDDPAADSDLDVASPAYGLQAASTATMLLAQGAGGLIYWQLQDFNWNRKQHGLLAENGERRPVAAAMKALFGGVPAGAKAVGAKAPRTELPAVALQAGGKSYLMLVNRGAQAQAVTAKLSGAQGCSSLVRIDAYNTGGSDARSAVRNASVQSCTVKAELQPGTVATILMQ